MRWGGAFVAGGFAARGLFTGGLRAVTVTRLGALGEGLVGEGRRAGVRAGVARFVEALVAFVREAELGDFFTRGGWHRFVRTRDLRHGAG
jgi:hypothetical protein